MNKVVLTVLVGLSAVANSLHAAVELGSVDVKAVPVRTPPPAYSPELRRQKEEGVVVVTLVIDAKGEVAEANVSKSTNPKLERVAVDGVRRWKFKPAQKDGVAVASQVSVPLHFQVDE